MDEQGFGFCFVVALGGLPQYPNRGHGAGHSGGQHRLSERAKDLLDTGRSAPLVKMGDVDALASALLSVLAAPPRSGVLTEAVSAYHWDASAAAYPANTGFIHLTHPTLLHLRTGLDVHTILDECSAPKKSRTRKNNAMSVIRTTLLAALLAAIFAMTSLLSLVGHAGSDHQEILALYQGWIRAVEGSDIDGYVGGLHPDVSLRPGRAGSGRARQLPRVSGAGL